MDKRVVVTGIGAISALGTTPDALWQACLDGRSGIGPLARFDSTGFTTRISAEVGEIDPERWVDGKIARRCDRFTVFAIAAAREAIASANLDITDENADEVGVLIGSGIGGMQTWEDQHTALMARGPSRVSPFFVPMMIVNMASGMVSILTGARGPNSAIATACATGTMALGEACAFIRRGAAKAMIAGGSEAAITPLAMAGFSSARAVSRRNDEPTLACRPFDANRDGFVMGEGSTVMVLEDLEWARERGAPILAEVLGYGMSGDAYHITAPRPDGSVAVRAMAAALKDAGLAPGDISYINAHAPGTPDGDAMEAAAIAELFGGSAPVSSTKPIHGHQLGATGASEFFICIQAVREGLIPHTVNCDNPNVDERIDIVRGEPRRTEVKYAMSNSLGFGGHNAVLVASGAP
jgi:3-oxoacyl-[acyl-carrier-protein] synthase II